MNIQVLLFFYLSSLKFAWCTVILSSGPYCSSDGNPVATFAVPDDTISITCAVDNPDGGLNILSWEIPSFGVNIGNVNGANGVDADQPEFQSVVNDFNNTEDTTNATLSFPAVTGLDEAVVTCQDNNNPAESSSCTLFILTPPSVPTSLMCTDITTDSLTLQWGEPTDNGGEEVSHYNITGTPGNISIVQSGNNVTLKSLIQDTTYYFTISANNSLGFGPEATVDCTTERNKPPPMFDNVTVCLDFNATGDNNLNPTLVVEALPCPLSIKAERFTPEITNYAINTNGSSIFVEEDPGVCNFVVTVNPGVYTIDVCASNIVGTSKTPYNNGSVFYALWLRDVRVMDITNSSAAIHYTTADCVERDEFLDIELVVAPSVTTATSQYYTSTYSSFTLTSLLQDNTVMFTLQVVVTSTRVTVASTIGSFIVSSIEETTTTSVTTTPIATPSDSPTPTASSDQTMITIIAAVGSVGGIGFVALVIVTPGGLYICYIKKKNRKTSGPNDDPIPLRESKGPLPETGQVQAVYQDPNTIEREKAPTGDMYALPDKPRRQPPRPGPTSATETTTYQDPNTIERQLAPTGDMYAMPQKKPQYSKGSPAMYAELGFEDGSQPPISPSGQPLIPQDKAQVMYAAVRGQ